jgi:hypothetical protein
MNDRLKNILQVFELNEVILWRFNGRTEISEEEEAFFYKTYCQDDLEKMQSLDLEDFEHMAGLILKYN